MALVVGGRVARDQGIIQRRKKSGLVIFQRLAKPQCEIVGLVSVSLSKVSKALVNGFTLPGKDGYSSPQR